MIESDLQGSVRPSPSAADTPTTSSTFSDQPHSSNDTPTIGSGTIDSPLNNTEPTTTTIDSSTPIVKKRRKRRKKTQHKSKMITGYIIYASEIRKDVIKKYPNREFGDISKLVGTEWKNLPADVKFAYEKRAQEQNAKSKAFAAQQKLELDRLSFAEQANQNLNSNSNTISNNNNPMMMNNNSLVTQCHPNGSIHNLPSISQQCNGHSSIDHACHSPNSFNGDPTSSGRISQCPTSSTMVHSSQQKQIQFAHNCSIPNQHHYLPSTPNLAPSPVINMTQNCSEFNKFNTQNLPTTSTISNQTQFTINGSNGNCMNHNFVVNRDSNHAKIINGNCNNLLSNSITASPNNSPIIQYQKNNIVYKKPLTVRLKPKDSSTQTSPIKWIQDDRPKKPLKFSQKFIDYLISNYPDHSHLEYINSDVDMNISNDNDTNTN